MEKDHERRLPATPIVNEVPVCIFAKPPVAGRVKTRIASVVGGNAAAALASALLGDTWSVVQNVPGVKPVLAAAEAGLFPIVIPAERMWLQDPGELGWRIESILRRGLADSPAVIALGADSPLLTPAHLRGAIECLAAGDAVLGPARDGGFYLLGLHDCPRGLLAGLPWSTEETLARTEERLRWHGMSVHRTESLSDVDTVTDLERLRDELRNAPEAIAPRTRRWLNEARW